MQPSRHRLFSSSIRFFLFDRVFRACYSESAVQMGSIARISKHVTALYSVCLQLPGFHDPAFVSSPEKSEFLDSQISKFPNSYP